MSVENTLHPGDVRSHIETLAFHGPTDGYRSLLRIHLHEGSSHPSHGIFHLLRRIRQVIVDDDPRMDDVILKIENLALRSVVTVEGAGKVVELPLPEGTYRIVLTTALARRSYVMALQPDTSVDLYLDYASS